MVRVSGSIRRDFVQAPRWCKRDWASKNRPIRAIELHPVSHEHPGMIRVGSVSLELWHLVLLALLVAALVWLLRAFLVRVSGTWERVDEGLRPGQSEVIDLVQFGPFIRGRRIMPGGFQEYTGVLRGRTMFMTRRDHGEPFIVGQGFPKELAAEIDGSVTAKLRLTLSADGTAIFGTFTPQKIEFTYRPPAITRRHFLEPSHRRYRLVSRELLNTHAPRGPEPKGRRRVRKTV